MTSFGSVLRSLDWSYLTGLLEQISPAVLCIMIHEICHGAAAYALGDRTAATQGRLSLNPLHHVDWFGLVMLAVFHFGWAKPVSVNVRNFKHPKRDMAITALAGPASNFLLAALALFLFGFFFRDLHGAAAGQFVIRLLQYMAILSISLGLFNLIPIPPLDGSKVSLRRICPHRRFRGFASRINMDDLTFHLPNLVNNKGEQTDFTGPLSLILQLLSRNKVEIKDIRIGDILDQYLEWLARMERMDLEVTGEFITMASYLLYIKAKTLLEGTRDVEELGELISSLEAQQRKETLERMKQAADWLGGRSELGAGIFIRTPEPITGPPEYRYAHKGQEHFKRSKPYVYFHEESLTSKDDGADFRDKENMVAGSSSSRRGMEEDRFSRVRGLYTKKVRSLKGSLGFLRICWKEQKC